MNYTERKFYSTAIVFVILAVCLTTQVNAQLQTARIFGNGMVLQRDKEISVWGKSAAGDTVYATLDIESDTVITDAEGNWEVSFPAMGAGGPYTMTLESNSGSITRNVYVGDVWLACGQSNMNMVLSQSDGGVAEAASANYPTIRQFKVQGILGTEPANDVPAGSSWKPATSEYAGEFSAVGYYFARDLQADIKIPIGIINSSLGGARIETFMSEEMLGFDENDVVLANGEQERQPTLAYNTMIHPLIKFPVKGVIWYQGESNADNMKDALAYGNLFKRLITDWRELWGLGDIPFLWVQLPAQGTPAVESVPGAWDTWPQLRAGQSRAMSLPYTGEAVTIDVGDEDIHPTNKEPVGYRLSRIARKVAYEEDIVYSGPRYKSHRNLNDGRYKIEFDHTNDGLVAINSVNDSVHWFSMAKSDGSLVSAKAILDSDSVIVWSDGVADPVAIRYAWEYNPENTNLYNQYELPAAPFFIIADHPGFTIGAFNSSDTIIERGSGAVLNWTVYGASSVTLNNEPVDSVDGIMVWPSDTTVYTLRAVSRFDTEDKNSATITIDVIEPLPTIVLSSDLGEVIEPGTEITLIANASTKGGNSVVKVEFFVDDELLSVDSLAPYEVKWSSDTVGVFNMTGIVYDNIGVSVQSAPLVIDVTLLEMAIYEAEDASFTGSGTEVSSAAASGGKYMDMTDGWVLTFSGISITETKNYQLSIRYLLNYESPKSQNLVVNGTPFSTIEFTAPNKTTWMTYRVNIQLVAGDNEIQIVGSWNWMSFDYIAIAMEDTTATSTSEYFIDKESMKIALNNYPNPFNSSTLIAYNLPEQGYVELEIFDIAGKKVAVIVNESMPAGSHSLEFDTAHLDSGVYFSKLSVNSAVTMKKMLLVR